MAMTLLLWGWLGMQGPQHQERAAWVKSLQQPQESSVCSSSSSTRERHLQDVMVASAERGGTSPAHREV